MTQDLYAKGLDQLTAYFGEPLYHVSGQTEEVAGLRIRVRTSKDSAFLLTHDAGDAQTAELEIQKNDTDFVLFVTPTASYFVPIGAVVAAAREDAANWEKDPNSKPRPFTGEPFHVLRLHGDGTYYDRTADFTARGFLIP